ncbi:duplicated orphan permease [Pedobacter westerhofensis]|uniref:Duplicated orphan permease n=1 Tax=Pedobacter westerhofensis TaxID=425512 RepID=A0A521AE64_9SPHI|nr:ABC transporter permease [Pedobacter westerhofensis]SMO33103.1 duplicated orphan permease [Pedobacter westerhofensis]
MLKLNLNIALRNLWKNKGFTLINIGGLAIGLASCMVLLLYVNNEWNYDKQFTNYQNTYVVYNNIKASDKTFSVRITPNAMAAEIRAKIPGIAYASHSADYGSQLISYQDRKFKKQAIAADPAFLKILDYKFVKGNPNTVLREVNSVILTKTLAKSLFGNEDPINKTVKFDNKESLKVEAVIEDVPANSSFSFDYLVPWAFAEKMLPDMKNPNWGDSSYLTLIQLQDQSFFNQINAAIRGIFVRHDKNSNSEAFLHPLAKLHLYGDFENGKSVGGRIDQLRILLVLAFCILLIACINFMNLTTAKSGKRAKEVGVRKAIGSSRNALVFQFITESMLISLLSTALAFALVEISLPYFNNLLGISLKIEYENWKFWITLLGLVFFTGVLAGSYPAFYLSSFESVKALKGLSVKAGSSFSVRSILVVFQFVFAVCLIICTTVIYQQLNYIKNKPVGYNKHNLIQIEVSGKLDNQKKLDLLKDRLLKSGAATHVSFFNADLNFNSRNTNAVSWGGKSPNESTLFNYRSAGNDFVETMGTRMVAGREFSAQYSDSNRVIINEAAVKVMGLKHPVGTTITFWESPVVIIGVMKDFVSASAYQKVAPMIFHPVTRFKAEVVLLRLNEAENIGSSLAQVDDIVKSMNPDYPVNRTFMDESFEKKFAEEQLLGTLSNWFGGFAIFISCLGLLGLALYMAEQRKKEISIRKVLGASTYSVLALLNGDFIRLVAIANVIAFPLGYIFASKWLSGFDFRVDISLLPFALAAVLSVIIALLTVSIQSVKVAKANPVDALRSE